MLNQGSVDQRFDLSCGRNSITLTNKPNLNCLTICLLKYFACPLEKKELPVLNLG